MPNSFDLPRRRWLALALAASQLKASRDDDKPFRINMGKAVIEVSLQAGAIDLAAPNIMQWITVAARAVTAYYGHFPTLRALVEVRVIEGRAGVLGGTTYGSDPPRTTMRLGQHTATQQLDRDWTMTHEFIHLAFPSMTRQHSWLEEGQATYIEPIARAQIGTLTAERVWGDMVHDMPQGLPGPTDRGLDFTKTWGRTYWGGALFCLLADVGIRERTGNQAGLQQALRGVNAAGGNIEYDWSIEEALKTADDAVKVSVMTDLYNQMKDKPLAPNLDDLWKRLGVNAVEGRVQFDNNAPLARVRQSITLPVG